MRGAVKTFAAIAAVAVACLSSSTPALAEDAPKWRAVGIGTGAGDVRDIAGLEELASAFPDSAWVRLRLLQPLVSAGESDRVLEILLWLKKRGYVFGEVSQQQIPKLLDETYAQQARSLLLPSADRIEASMLAATIPTSAGQIEGVFSPGVDSDIFIVTSISNNALYNCLPDGECLPLTFENANDLSGIVSQADTKIGWVASSNIDESDDELPRFNGLYGIADASQPPIMIPAPDGVTLSDLSITPDNTLFASDPIHGGVYSKAAGANTLTTVLEPGTIRSAQGSAPSADGTKLYVSDYRYGIAIIDIGSGVVHRLTSDVPAILDGVDGLWLHKGELIAVQNGISPMRISGFTLSEDGMRVTAARTIEQAHSEWTEPLGGSISGDDLVYVATGQWDKYSKGALVQGEEPIPTQIRRLPLGGHPD